MYKSIGLIFFASLFVLIANNLNAKDIPGYTYGESNLETALYTLKDLKFLKTTVLFTEDDAKWLRKSRKVL